MLQSSKMTAPNSDFEMLDVVDEQDRVIDTLTRAEIHRRGLRHRACHILVYNSAGELFLQQRAWHKDSDPGLWDSSCAGHVDAGEDYAACAVRELQEELGIVLEEPLKPLFMLRPSEVSGWEFVQVYTLLHNGSMRLCPDELLGGEWFSPQTIQQRIVDQPDTLSSAFKKIWTMNTLY